MVERLYFAYGSNINLEQMAERCPAAEAVGTAVLDGYELLFRGNRRGDGVATIEPLPGNQVHGLLWRLTPACEQSLDSYEGYPHLYEKQNLLVRAADGKEIVVMVYVMTGERWRYPIIPSNAYYEGILQGYRQNGLPESALEAALKNAHDEVQQCLFFERMQDEELFAGRPAAKGRKERSER